MKKLIYKIHINPPKLDETEINNYVGVYEDGTWECLDVPENQKEKAKKRILEWKDKHDLFYRSHLQGTYNPRYPKAFNTAGGFIVYFWVSCNDESDEIEYFGEGAPWEPDPQFENCVF